MRILSIDFDWVMEPCIQVYNAYTQAPMPLGAYGAWKEIEKNIPAISTLNLEMDYVKYQTLYFFVQDIMRNFPNTPIAVRNNHAELVDVVLPRLPQNDFILSVTSIDHHHDCGYQKDPTPPQFYLCNNWVSYLAYLPNVTQLQYQWINNKNSDLKIKTTFPDNFMYNFSGDLLSVDIKNKFDLVFICPSWEWVPLKYEPLFDIFCDMALSRGERI